MRFPLIRRSAHQREVTRLGEAYRWEVERERLRAERAEAEMRQWVGEHVTTHQPQYRYDRDTRVFTVEVSGNMIDHFLHPGRGKGAHRLARYVGENVAVQLLGLNRDPRPDLRKT